MKFVECVIKLDFNGCEYIIEKLGDVVFKKMDVNVNKFVKLF